MADKNMEAQISVEFEEATSRQSLNSGETINTLWSKVKRWLSDLKAVAFSGSYNDLSDAPTSLPANGGNAETVNGHTVESNVPALGYYYATCDSPLTTNIKAVTCEGFEFKEGARITVRFTAGNGENPPSAPVFVLKINEDAGRPIAYNDWDGEGILGIIDSKKSEAFCGNQVWDFIFINGRFIMQVPLRGYQMDDTLSDRSSNPVQNKVIKQAIDNKADKTTATKDTDGLMSAGDKSKLDNADNKYASKSIYGDTAINVGRKADTTVGSYSSAVGQATTASGYSSHAEGLGATASGHYSHAEGSNTTASGEEAHAEGHMTTASGRMSHSEGQQTIASGDWSHAGGYLTNALHDCEVAYGRYNISNDDTLFSIGDGDNTKRHNAFEITTTGCKLHDKDIATTDLIPTELPANGGNADTVGGKSASDFVGTLTSDQISNIRILIPDDVDVVDWLIKNAKIGNLYFVQAGCTGQTNLPPLTGWGWAWFSFDGNRYFCRVMLSEYKTIDYMLDRVNYFGGWKEISTTPIKSTPYSSTTDDYSICHLWGSSENKIPIAVILTDMLATIFYSSLNLYAFTVQQPDTHLYKPNIQVSGTVYYIEI